MEPVNGSFGPALTKNQLADFKVMKTVSILDSSNFTYQFPLPLDKKTNHNQ